MEKLDADPIFLHTVARLCLICTGLCARSPLFKVIPSLIPLFYKVQLYFRNTVVIFQSPLRYKIHIKVLFFKMECIILLFGFFCAIADYIF